MEAAGGWRDPRNLWFVVRWAGGMRLGPGGWRLQAGGWRLEAGSCRLAGTFSLGEARSWKLKLLAGEIPIISEHPQNKSRTFQGGFTTFSK